MKKTQFRGRPSNHAGFTLVELLVVMAIIAILVGVLIGPVSAAMRSAQRVKAANMATQIQTACMSYYTEYSIYPDNPTPFPAGTDYVISDKDAANWKDLLISLCGAIDPATGLTVTTPAVPNSRAIAFLSVKPTDLLNDAPKNPLPPDTTTHLYFNIAIDE